MDTDYAKKLAAVINSPTLVIAPSRAVNVLGTDDYARALREGVLVPSIETGGLSVTSNGRVLADIRQSAGSDNAMPAANASYQPSHGRQFFGGK